MSNYPPGVTGNEPQIVGYDEHETECENCGAEVTAFGQFTRGPGSRMGLFSYECEACGFESYENEIWLEEN